MSDTSEIDARRHHVERFASRVAWAAIALVSAWSLVGVGVVARRAPDEPPELPPRAAACHLETPVAEAVTQGATVDFRGWGYPEGPRVADRVSLVWLARDGSAVARVMTRMEPRPDVEVAQRDSTLRASGFVAQGSVVDVPAGRYALALDLSVSGRRSRCALGRTIDVRARAAERRP